MSMIRSLFEPMAAGSSGDINSFDLFQASTLFRKTSSGEVVSPSRAMTLSVWFACIRNIAEDVGKLPLKIYRRVGTGKELASEVSIYSMLHTSANLESTAAAFRETMTGWALSYGNAYAEIQRDRQGRPIALWPIHPEIATIKRVDGEIFLDIYSQEHGVVRLPYADVFHLRGFGTDPLCGLSVAALAAESLGVSLAAQTYGGSFFANGAIPAGILTHPGKLSEPAQANLRESWKKRYAGSRNANNIAVLQEGIKFEAMSIPPEQSQFLQTREFQIPEIARWFRMPPHKIGDLTRSTNNNIEHQAIEYVVDTLMPWLVRWEQEAARKLLDAREQESLVIEHVVDGLLRGDSTARVNYYRSMIQIGAMSPDEARARENMNAIPGGDGAKFYMQGAMMPLDKLGQQVTASPQVTDPQPDPQPTQALLPFGIEVTYNESGAISAIVEKTV